MIEKRLVGRWHWLPFPLLEQQPVALSAASLEVGSIPFRICAVEAQDFALCEDEWYSRSRV
jgi:hypothetical protein